MSEYLGWKAGVIPTNDDNLRFISSQLMAIDERRRQAEAAKAAAEAKRQGDLLNYMDKATSGALFETDPSQQPEITGQLLNIKNGLIEEIKKNPNEVEFAQKVNGAIGGIANLAKTYKSFGTSIRDEVAKRAKIDPSIDWASALDVAISEAFDKRDEKGKVIGKKGLNEIDISDPSGHLNRVIMNHKDKLLTQNRYATLQNAIKDPKPNKQFFEPQYDEKGEVIKEGGDAEWSKYFKPKVGPKGGVVDIELVKEPYKIEGKEIVDPKGNPVMVIPEQTFNELYLPGSGIAASVDRTVEEQFPGTDMNSLDADMKRRMVMTELVEKFGDKKFVPKDDSRKIKADLADQRMKERRLQLMEQSNTRAWQRLNQGTNNAPENRDVYAETINILEERQAGVKSVKNTVAKSPFGKLLSIVPDGVTPLTDLPSEASDRIYNTVLKSYPKAKQERLSSGDVYVWLDKASGKIVTYAPKNPGDDENRGLERKGTFSANDLNMTGKVNQSVKERQANIQEYGPASEKAPKEDQKPQPQAKPKKVKGTNQRLY